MTGSVRIAAPTIEDRDPFLEAVDRSRSLHADWVHPPSTPEAFADYVFASGERCHAFFLVRECETNQIAGVINLSNIIRGSLCSAFVGFYAMAPWNGRGYMKRGIREVLRQAFGDLRLHRVEANVQPHNRTSLALVQACGFQKEGFSRKYLKIAGEWRDHERWAILEEDFRATERSGEKSGSD